MEPFLRDPDVTLWHGDARDVLRSLPDGSVDCVVTSPPFWGLRDYGTGDQQIGLEATPEEWVDRLVGVFRECRRVLSDSGVMFVECGDSYAGQRSYQVSDSKHQAHEFGLSGAARPPVGCKPKDLIGQPFMLAFALRADGWYWRGCYPWNKPNAMPESAKDRCTTAHSYVLHFAKRVRYWWDGEAIAEPAAWDRWGDQTVPKYEGTQTATGWMQPRTKDELRLVATKKPDGWATHEGGHGSFHRDGREKGEAAEIEARTKNARSVWTIPTSAYADAHFATFPEALARRMILAGCPQLVCRVCRKPRERIVERVPTGYDGSKYGERAVEATGGAKIGGTAASTLGSSNGRLTADHATVGWSDCGHDDWRPGVVLDPFLGSGTVARVARNHGRHAVGIELKADYLQLACERLAQLSLLAESVEASPPAEDAPKDEAPEQIMEQAALF